MSRPTIDRLGQQGLYEDAALLATLLSQRYFSDGFGRDGTQLANTYFRRFNGMLMSATLGMVVPWDVEIVGYGVSRGNANAGTVEIRDDGAAVVSIVMGANLVVSGTVASPTTIAAGSVISGYWNSANTTTNVQVVFYYRTRP